MTVVLIDGPNVEHCSAWRAFAGDGGLRILDAVVSWAMLGDHTPTVVYDGEGPLGTGAERWEPNMTIIGSGDTEADQVLERLASDLATARRPYWLVTSDVAVRRAAGARADRVIAADDFVAELLAPFEDSHGAVAPLPHPGEHHSSRLADTVGDGLRAKLERLRRGE